MRIVSGGQTGVDRAALDAALQLGLPCGGWCPAGRWAEDGPIAERYPLRETPSPDPDQRTAWNVRDSDATLILAALPLAGGTARTRELAVEQGRPVLLADPRCGENERVREWLAALRPGTLNVAGPRESEVPGVYAAAMATLVQLLGSCR